MTWFKQEKIKADSYIQEINAKIKNILPSIMERILTVAEVVKIKVGLLKTRICKGTRAGGRILSSC